MSIDKLRIFKTRNVKTPSRGTSVAAGLDFFVPEDLTAEDIMAMETKTGHEIICEFNDAGYMTSMVIGPGQSACIPSGIKAKIPHGYCMEFHNKSGIGVKKSLLAGACLIDEDYEGEWHIDVHNVSGTNNAYVKAGDKLAQFVMYAVEYPAVEIAESEQDLFSGSNSERGSGWAGSTGTK